MKCCTVVIYYIQDLVYTHTLYYLLYPCSSTSTERGFHTHCIERYRFNKGLKSDDLKMLLQGVDLQCDKPLPHTPLRTANAPLKEAPSAHKPMDLQEPEDTAGQSRSGKMPKEYAPLVFAAASASTASSTGGAQSHVLQPGKVVQIDAPNTPAGYMNVELIQQCEYSHAQKAIALPGSTKTSWYHKRAQQEDQEAIQEGKGPRKRYTRRKTEYQCKRCGKAKNKSTGHEQKKPGKWTCPDTDAMAKGGFNA